MTSLLQMSPQALREFLVDVVPFNRALDMQVVECTRNRLVLDLPYAEQLVGNPLSGAVHEGAVTTLIDTACGSVVLTHGGDLRRSATLDLRLEFLRQGRRGMITRCEARCLRVTDNVAYVRAVAHEGDPGDPLAEASGCFGGVLQASGLTGGCFVNAQGGPNDLQMAVDTVAYARMLGIELHHDDGTVLARLTAAPQVIGNPQMQSQHGGAIGSLLQIVARSQLMTAMNASRIPRLFSCNVEYLAATRSADTYATATVMSRSRRYANVRAQAYQDSSESLVATATVQFLLTD